MSSELKITVLTEDSAKMNSHTLAEHGLSLYLECDNLKLLFDLGDTDVYLKNAAKMGIDLQSIDFIAFSHNHYDHVGGLKYFPTPSKKIKLVAQKCAFYPRVNYQNDLSRKEITENFEIVSIDAGIFELSENLIFLGQIPRLNDFEGKKNFGKMVLPSGELADDFCEEDSALIYKAKEGIVVITGCSHSGICNIIQYAVEIAKKKWGISQVKTILGGLHLVHANEELLTNTINFLKNKEIIEVYPCHCTDLYAKITMACCDLKVHEVSTGTVINF